MAQPKRPEITNKDVTGLKYFDKLAPLLRRLHDAGCERDRAGNRRLHFDQFCMLELLFLFNPIVSSLRAIEQASGGQLLAQEGTLYPALHRLENRGLLTADWKMSDTGRESKFYRLTPKGRKQLKEEAASWLRLTEAIDLILKTAGGSL